MLTDATVGSTFNLTAPSPQRPTPQPMTGLTPNGGHLSPCPGEGLVGEDGEVVPGLVEFEVAVPPLETCLCGRCRASAKTHQQQGDHREEE